MVHILKTKNKLLTKFYVFWLVSYELIYANGQVVFDLHTVAFWNITIQWTSHDDLTEKKIVFNYFKKQFKKSWNQSGRKVT